MIPSCVWVLQLAAGLLRGHLATSFLNLFLPSHNCSPPSFLFFFPSYRISSLFTLLLAYSVSSFSFCPSILTTNLNLSSWVSWPEPWALGPDKVRPDHWKTQMKASDMGCWDTLGLSSQWLIYTGWVCRWFILCLLLGAGSAEPLVRNVIHVCWCPHSLSTFCSLNPTPVGWHFCESVSSPTPGIFLLSNSFNTHAHLSSAQMYKYEINGNIRIILCLSYIIADFLRSLFKRPEDVN